MYAQHSANSSAVLPLMHASEREGDTHINRAWVFCQKNIFRCVRGTAAISLVLRRTSRMSDVHVRACDHGKKSRIRSCKVLINDTRTSFFWVFGQRCTRLLFFSISIQDPRIFSFRCALFDALGSTLFILSCCQESAVFISPRRTHFNNRRIEKVCANLHASLVLCCTHHTSSIFLCHTFSKNTKQHRCWTIRTLWCI